MVAQGITMISYLMHNPHTLLNIYRVVQDGYLSLPFEYSEYIPVVPEYDTRYSGRVRSTSTCIQDFCQGRPEYSYSEYTLPACRRLFSFSLLCCSKSSRSAPNKSTANIVVLPSSFLSRKPNKRVSPSVTRFGREKPVRGDVTTSVPANEEQCKIAGSQSCEY
jgi:hypothetical protein